MILDYHVEVALIHGYKQFRDRRAAFDFCFPGVATSVLDDWWAVFIASPPTIASVFKRGVDKVPLIHVGPPSDDTEERPMGDFVYKDTDKRMVGQELLSQQLAVRIVAQSPTLMRIWYTLVYHILFAATRDLIRAGYDDFTRESADDFSADEEQLGEQYGLAGLMAREVRVKARLMTNVKFWGTVHTTKPWYTLAEDQQTLDADRGGVVAS